MKFSKIIYKTALCATMAVSLSSCGGDWLDLQPSDSADADNAITSSADLRTAYVGMYAAFKGTSSFTDYYGRVMNVYGETRGEDVQYNYKYGSNRAAFYYYMEYKTADQFTSDNAVWQSPYIVISRANRILEANNLSDAESAATKIAQYKNEAKVMRAYALFDLTRIYGKPYTEDNGASLGVPFSEASLESTAKPSRSTVADNYTQILKDLEDAINSGALEEEATPGYLNVWAAKALLSRVYLTMGNYSKALSVSEDIIEHSPYVLWTSAQYAKAWDKGDAAHGNEMIFELVINDNTDWTDREGIAYLYRENGNSAPGYGDLVVTKKFSDMLKSDPNDVRNKVLLTAEKDPDNIFNGTAVYINKMPPYNGDVRYANVPMLRLSEVYLTAAEAAFETGAKDKAALYLNKIITNRTTDASKVVTEGTITKIEFILNVVRSLLVKDSDTLTLFVVARRLFDILLRQIKVGMMCLQKKLRATTVIIIRLILLFLSMKEMLIRMWSRMRDMAIDRPTI